MREHVALPDDSERLAQFAQRLQDVGKASGDDSIQQRKSLLELMHGLANYTADRKPAELDPCSTAWPAPPRRCRPTCC